MGGEKQLKHRRGVYFDLPGNGLVSGLNHVAMSGGKPQGTPPKKRTGLEAYQNLHGEGGGLAGFWLLF